MNLSVKADHHNAGCFVLFCGQVLGSLIIRDFLSIGNGIAHGGFLVLLKVVLFFM